MALSKHNPCLKRAGVWGRGGGGGVIRVHLVWLTSGKGRNSSPSMQFFYTQCERARERERERERRRLSGPGWSKCEWANDLVVQRPESLHFSEGLTKILIATNIFGPKLLGHAGFVGTLWSYVG